MAWKVAVFLTWVVAALVASGPAYAQSGIAACPPNHVRQYNPDTYRQNCLSLNTAGNKRHEALLKEQKLLYHRLRREQLERTLSLSQPEELLRSSQQQYMRKLSRQSR